MEIQAVIYDRSGRYDDDGLSEYGFGDERASIDGSGSFREAGKDENEMLLVDQDGNVLLVLERN